MMLLNLFAAAGVDVGGDDERHEGLDYEVVS